MGESSAGERSQDSFWWAWPPLDPAATKPEATVGEWYAINVDPDEWGSWLGADLIERGVAALSEFGFTDAVLWVHPGNERARRFYVRRGWVDDEVERRQTVLGVEVPEEGYSLDVTSTRTDR